MSAAEPHFRFRAREAPAVAIPHIQDLRPPDSDLEILCLLGFDGG